MENRLENILLYKYYFPAKRYKEGKKMVYFLAVKKKWSMQQAYFWFYKVIN